MTTMQLTAVTGALVGLGIMAVIVGLIRVPDVPRASSNTWARARAFFGIGNQSAITRRRSTIAISAAVGLIIAVSTGLYILVVVLPVAVVGIPPLVRPSKEAHATQRLADLETWVRGLAGILSSGGAGLEQGLRASLGSAPASIRPPLSRLVARLDAQQPVKPALLMWAEEMNDSLTDLIAATLILESERRQGGISKALQELAGSVSDQTRARMKIEVERAGPRATARWVTIISLVVIAVGSASEFFAPYRTPVGQLVAIFLIALYAGCLLWSRQMAMGKPIPRFLPASDRSRP